MTPDAKPAPGHPTHLPKPDGQIRGGGQPARGSTTPPRKTTTPEKSSQIANTKGRFTIITNGGGGGSSIIAAPHMIVVTAAASVPFSLTSTKSFFITPIKKKCLPALIASSAA